MKNMERDRFLSREAQMSMEIEDLQRELNKQKLILNQTSMAKLADTVSQRIHNILSNNLFSSIEKFSTLRTNCGREICLFVSKIKSSTVIGSRRPDQLSLIAKCNVSRFSEIVSRIHKLFSARASVLAAAGNLPSAGSSSESFQNGLDVEAREALLSFILR